MIRQELQPEFLLNAYAQGYFPMPDPHSEGLLWFRPDPRTYFDLQSFHASRSLRRSVRHFNYTFSLNQDFLGVMEGCADRDDTWINEEFMEAYSLLHQHGYAHSMEVWQEDKLVGGLYGVHLGGMFFAESKFHRNRDASKAALWCLIESMKESNMLFLEVQFMTDHLRRLGALEISDEAYQKILAQGIFAPCSLELSQNFPKKS